MHVSTLHQQTQLLGICCIKRGTMPVNSAATPRVRASMMPVDMNRDAWPKGPRLSKPPCTCKKQGINRLDWRSFWRSFLTAVRVCGPVEGTA